MIRVAGAVLIALAAWVGADILGWQRVFETDALWKYDAAYQRGHEFQLVGLIGLGIFLLHEHGWRSALAYALALYTLAHGGPADVLYYILDGRPVPAELPWLAVGHPLMFGLGATRDGLLTVSGAWSLFWLAAWGTR